MLMHYWANGPETILRRASTAPEFATAIGEGWHTVRPERAVEIARTLPGWVVVPIHEIDYHALLGDGWKEFAFEPTEAQRERCRTNHQGRSLEEVSAAEGFRWEELVAILTDQPWRRLIPMRAFTVARDWPLSIPQ